MRKINIASSCARAKVNRPNSRTAEVDPIVRPNCGGTMKNCRLSTDYGPVDRIIDHLKMTLSAEKEIEAKGARMIRRNPSLVLIVLTLLPAALFFSCGKTHREAERTSGSEAAESRAGRPGGFAASTAPMAPRFIPDPLVFTRFSEPRESAFSCLVPKGWTTEGGIFYVDPNAAGGYANATGPKINFAVKKDAAGTVMLCWPPDYYYFDARSSPAGQMGYFRPGSNYNGMRVMPLPSAAEFLSTMVLRQLRPQAQGLQIVESRALPEVAARFAQAAPVQGFQYDAAEIVVSYAENGSPFKEKLLTVIENLGPLGGGMWQNRQTVAARAPADEFDEWSRVGEVIYHSVKINPQWLAAAIRAANERSETGLRVQRYVEQLDKDILANKARNNAEIRHDSYLNLTGQEDYVNPYSGETEIRPAGWKYHWENPSGEIVMSNNQSYDPNHDISINRSDFKPSPVRKN